MPSDLPLPVTSPSRIPRRPTTRATSAHASSTVPPLSVGTPTLKTTQSDLPSPVTSPSRIPRRPTTRATSAHASSTVPPLSVGTPILKTTQSNLPSQVISPPGVVPPISVGKQTLRTTAEHLPKTITLPPAPLLHVLEAITTAIKGSRCSPQTARVINAAVASGYQAIQDASRSTPVVRRIHHIHTLGSS
jgi:hypothetical protein